MRATSLFNLPKGVGLLPGPILKGVSFEVAPEHENIARKLAELGALTIAGESSAPPVSADANDSDEPTPHVQKRPLYRCRYCGNSWIDHARFVNPDLPSDVLCRGARRFFVRWFGDEQNKPPEPPLNIAPAKKSEPKW